MAALKQQLLKHAMTDGEADPASACQPFGQASRGVVIGEGGGLVVLESLEHARQRGARIYAEVSGFGASNNAFHWARPDPSGRPVTQSLSKALDDASSSVDHIGLVNPFGLGLAALDEPEARGWNALFGHRLAQIPAVTTRGSLGNSGAGSGALDFAVTVMSLYRASVPPSLNTSNPAPYSRFRFATQGPLDLCAEEAITLGYAPAGGQHAAIALRRFKE